MNMNVFWFVLALCLAISGPLAAQEPDEPPAVEEPDEAPDEADSEKDSDNAPDKDAEKDSDQARAEQKPVPPLPEALEAWEVMLGEEPQPLVLYAEGDLILNTPDKIKARLKTLGRMSVSNREWHRYWMELQAATETLLRANAKALEEAEQKAKEEEASDPNARWGRRRRPRVPRAGAVKQEKAAAALSEGRVAALEELASILGSKVTLLDAYFKTIQAERDVLEEQMDLLVQSDRGGKPESTPERLDDPSPYEAYVLRLEELKKQIAFQTDKKLDAEAQQKVVQFHLDNLQEMMTSLVAHTRLLKREARLYKEQVGGPRDALTASWVQLSKAMPARTESLARDTAHHKDLEDSYRVELLLLKSEIAFRDKRLETLKTEQAVDGDSAARIAAIQDTVGDWFERKGPRILATLVILGLVLLMVLWLISRAARTLVARSASGESASQQRRQTLAEVMSSVLRIAAVVIIGLTALDQTGVDIAPILGCAAIFGLAISFGSQNLVRDLVSGFFVLLENQYTIQDKVIINGHRGRVEKITLRSTWVRHNISGDLHIIPNGTIKSVTNRSRDWANAVLDIGVSYDADLDKVKAIVNHVGQELAADESWKFQKLVAEPPRWWGVVELADSCVVIRVIAPVKEGRTNPFLKELNLRLKKAFDRYGIEIPYPHLTIHKGE